MDPRAMVPVAVTLSKAVMNPNHKRPPNASVEILESPGYLSSFLFVPLACFCEMLLLSIEAFGYAICCSSSCRTLDIIRDRCCALSVLSVIIALIVVVVL